MSASRPSQYIGWNPSQSAVVQPTDSLRARGYQSGEAPTAQNTNWIYWLTDQWISYLDGSVSQSVMSATLDSCMRLIGGGTLGYTQSTGVITWSQPLFLSIASIADTDNQIAAGSVTASAGQVLYVQANVPFSSNADVASGSATLNNVAFTPGIAAGQLITGAGIPSNATVVSVSGNQVTMSAAATASAQQTPVTFASSGALVVKAANVASLLPNAQTVLLGRVTSAGAYIGVNASMVILRDGEQRRLLEAGYHDVRYLVAGQALSARQVVYVSSPADARTQGAVYPVDASQALGANRSMAIGLVTTAATSGATVSVMTGGIMGGFSGLSAGATYYVDPTTPGAVTLTKPTGAAYAIPVGIAIDTSNLYVRVSSASNAPVLDPSYNSVIVQPVAGDTTTTQLLVKNAAGTAQLTADASGNLTAVGTATAASVVSGVGFRSSLGPAMAQYSVAAGTTPGGSGNAPLNMAETNNFSNWTLRLPFAGSVVGSSVSFRFTATQSTPPTLYFQINKNNTAGGINFYQPNFTAASANANSDFPFAETKSKGTIPFAAGDTLTMQWYSTTNFSAACTLYIKVVVYVEFSA